MENKKYRIQNRANPNLFLTLHTFPDGTCTWIYTANMAEAVVFTDKNMQSIHALADAENGELVPAEQT